ncbi:MAG: DNA polymerase III subunit delta [Bacteroidales bacterium]|nr:DNA polymerase III subunit delta [Bacteroidales bacterium]
MTIEQLIKDINNKIYAPIYLLMGEETYYIDKITEYLMSKVLEEHEKAFNEHVFYGKDISAGQVDNIAKRFPMMANHQLVIVKEAQLINKFEDLVYYAANPLKSTILVLNYKYKSLAKSKKLYKEIEKNGVIFESKKLYENQVPDWIVNYLARKKIGISLPAAQLLTENLGNDLSRISSELDKLILTLPENTNRISPELIEANIGISKDYNNFELQKAVGMKDVYKANLIIHHFAKNPKEHPLALVINSLFSYFSKVLIYHVTPDKSSKNAASVLGVNPFFIKDYQVAAANYSQGKLTQIFDVLRTFDLKSKGVDASNTEPDELMKEMIFRIMH